MESATKRRTHVPPGTEPTIADRLVADFQAFVSDVEQALKGAAQQTGSSVQAVRSKLEDRVAQAREQLAEASTAIAKGVSKTRGVGEAYMRDRPWAILGAALVIGAVAGTLLTRKE
jgi:ElaB/YqjD/DUF883 family membrane-anchored ribosome-binding protein